MTLFQAMFIKRLAAELRSLYSEGWGLKLVSQTNGFIKLQHTRNGSFMVIKVEGKQLNFYKDKKLIKTL